MLAVFIFYVIILPLCTLLHEIGHGLGVLLTSKSPVHIYLGRKKDNKENFRIGRMHFHIVWSYVGFAYWDGMLNRRQRSAALAGGPLMTLLLSLIVGGMAWLWPHTAVRPVLWGTFIAAMFQFIFTVMPVKYPRWLGAYHGFESDGLQLWKLYKERQSAERNM